MKDFKQGFVYFKRALEFWWFLLNGNNLKFQEVIFEHLFWEYLSGLKED